MPLGVERGSSELIQPSWAQKFRSRLVLGEQKEEGDLFLPEPSSSPGFSKEALGLFLSIFSNQSFPFL